MGIVEIRKITPTMTTGVEELNMPSLAHFNLILEAVRRWKKDPADVFSKVEPDGINVMISNGMDVIGTKLICDFPGLREPVFVIVDDHGAESETGVAVTILLPNEF